MTFILLTHKVVAADVLRELDSKSYHVFHCRFQRFLRHPTEKRSQIYNNVEAFKGCQNHKRGVQNEVSAPSKVGSSQIGKMLVGLKQKPVMRSGI